MIGMQRLHHLLGVRPYASIPALLQHADVGLMPFNVQANPRGVDVLQPQKLYAYLASGLPVVASDWKTLRALGTPAQACATPDEFVAALRHAATAPPNRQALRQYAACFDWGRQVAVLLEHLESMSDRVALAG